MGPRGSDHRGRRRDGAGQPRAETTAGSGSRIASAASDPARILAEPGAPGGDVRGGLEPVRRARPRFRGRCSNTGPRLWQDPGSPGPLGPRADPKALAEPRLDGLGAPQDTPTALPWFLTPFTLPREEDLPC